MPKVSMRDMIVLLPGITGSVLQKDGEDLWGLSFRALWNALPSPHRRLQQLMLGGDDIYKDDLGDGITATALMPDAHLIPFFWKIDGYTAVARLISNYFSVIPGSLHDKKPANYFEFPYDWRRDNRYTARKLKDFIDERLAIWRGIQEDAKVIFLAHSMGGLAARYYLEVMGGWPDCRALITFGTPHRGSIKALNFLANGNKNLLVDLSDVVRSFTSTYQLLPRYKVVKVGSQYERVAEISNIPNVDKKRAEDALAFHREIEDAVNHHLKDEKYRKGYKTIPIVGSRQPTLQSAELSEGKLIVSNKVPSSDFDPLLEDGDGTVPRISATPIELGEEYRDTFFPELHGSLQNNKDVLGGLFERLKQMQIPNLDAYRGAEIDQPAAGKPAVGVELEDLYPAGEPAVIRAHLVNLDEPPGGLKAQVESSTGLGASAEAVFEPDGDGWVASINNLPPDLYRVSVRTGLSGPEAPSPVQDIFEVGV